jgi:zinc protease
MWGLRLAAAVLAATVALSVPAAGSEPIKTVMSHGLTVLVKPEPGSGIVAVEVYIKVGAAEEREFNAGIGNLIARTLLTSTRNRRAETVSAVIDSVGGNFQTNWHPDYTRITAITTTPGFNDTVALLGDILNNATFDQQFVERARQEVLTEVTSQSDDVFQSSYDRIRRELYRDNPYTRPTGGYIRTLRTITREDMQQFYRQYYVPNNMVIAIVGDVEPDEALVRVRMAFAGARSSPVPRQRAIPPEALEASKVEVIQRPISAAYLMFGFLAPGVTSRDYPAAQVTATALGSGKGSRMFQNLREQQGLAYDLGTIYPQMKNQSHIMAYLITDAYRRVFPGFSIEMMLEEVQQSVLAEITKLQEEPLSQEELKRAKRYTIGTQALRQQRIRDRASHLGWGEAMGLGVGYDEQLASQIDAVTAEDVQRFARQYLNKYVLTIVLPNGNN